MKKCAIIPAKDNRLEKPIHHEFGVWLMLHTKTDISIGFTDLKGNGKEPVLIVSVDELMQALRHIEAIGAKEVQP
jgi:hypothetical protein